MLPALSAQQGLALHPSRLLLEVGQSRRLRVELAHSGSLRPDELPVDIDVPQLSRRPLVCLLVLQRGHSVREGLRHHDHLVVVLCRSLKLHALRVAPALADVLDDLFRCCQGQLVDVNLRARVGDRLITAFILLSAGPNL